MPAPAGGTRWGFHRLASRVADRIVADAGIGPGDLVLDVGAGDGALTRPLVACGARVVAVELHPARAAELRRRFAAAAVTVVETDAADLWLPRRPFRVVANPPFASSVALLRRLTARGSRLERADLVLPAHLARRLAGGDLAGAARWQRAFVVAPPRRLERSAFTPPAPQPVALVVIERRRAPSAARPPLRAGRAAGRPVS